MSLQNTFDRVFFRVSLPLLVWLMLVPFAGAQQDQGVGAIRTNGEGVTNFRPNDQARSREEALEAAQRDAVERASGVMIESESLMRNYELVKDEVLSRSKGFIQSYKVISEKRQGSLYKVSIEALVVKNAFIKDLGESIENLYRRVGRPRVMVVIRERALDESGQPVEGEGGYLKGVSEKEIRKMLIKQGFTFIDPRAASGINLVEVALRGNTLPKEQVVEAARTTKAEIVILGNATVQGKGEYNGFNVAQSNLSLDVIRVDNGQVMASEVTNGRGLHVNESTAGVMSVQNASADIVPKMMEQVSYQWIRDKNEGNRIDMVVKNVTFRNMRTLNSALSTNVRGVRKVKQRSFQNGVGLFELTVRGTPDEVAESLLDAKFSGFSLDVEDVTANKLTVVLIKAAPKKN